MTQQKKLKKAIRARSEKTGESYTSARRQVLLAREEPAPPAPAPKPAVKGGISEQSVLKKTGHGLDHWFGVLDAFGGMTKGHTAMAAHLYKEHGIPGWHSQGITVAYERARGLREMNQACTGKFQVSVSKTVPATVAEVVEALKSAASWGADPGLVQALDAAFTGDKPREVKTKGSDYAWLRFIWDGRTVEIRITGKPKGASVVADNGDLPDPALVEQRRAQWRVALEGLHRHLGH
jgi:hypothetical protein